MLKDKVAIVTGAAKGLGLGIATTLGNLTPADVYFGRGETILLERERIKRKIINQRRLQHRKFAA